MLKFIPLLSLVLFTVPNLARATETLEGPPIVTGVVADAPDLVLRPVPRKSFVCAAILDTKLGADIGDERIAAALADPRAQLAKALAPSEPRTLLRRFLAWFDLSDEYVIEDLRGHVAATEGTVHAKDDVTFMRRVRTRLRRIEEDLGTLPASTFPVKTVLRGRDQIREYLLSVKKEAHRLETEHPGVEVVPEPVLTEEQIVKTRAGKYGRDLAATLASASGTVLWSVLAGAMIYHAPPDLDWQTVVRGLVAGVGIGVQGGWFHASLGKLKVSFPTYEARVQREEKARLQRMHEEHVQRGHEQLNQIDLMLSLLDDEQTHRNEIVYSGSAIDLPMRANHRFGKNAAVTGRKIEFFERNPSAIDPILSRWVLIDQLFQFDADGEPTLLTFVREQMSYGPRYNYDGWTNGMSPYGF